MENTKSKIGAGLFALLLGYLGIHNFYLGHIAKGVIQCALTVVASLVGWFFVLVGALTIELLIGFLIAPIGYVILIIPFGVWIWSVIEAILILTGKINKDAKGNPLV